ncbi:uncharacterized protein LOC128983567 [Macrosteles quadrilineatus]|uniref:uncharacterized protein LOC128983567 n=1 Tax=Macrosteles quadrilineatus TaxID=74068 RepID=UPI0023E0B33A|nr:uncharacterized protein LOC128983567 [Macrosteles quadrilineatus]
MKLATNNSIGEKLSTLIMNDQVLGASVKVNQHFKSITNFASVITIPEIKTKRGILELQCSSMELDETIPLRGHLNDATSQNLVEMELLPPYFLPNRTSRSVKLTKLQRQCL